MYILQVQQTYYHKFNLQCLFSEPMTQKHCKQNNFRNFSHIAQPQDIPTLQKLKPCKIPDGVNTPSDVRVACV